MSNLKSIGTRTMPTHIVQAPSNTLSKEARKSIGAAANYVPRVKASGEAVGEVIDERGEVDYISYVPPVGTALYTSPQQQAEPVAQRSDGMPISKMERELRRMLCIERHGRSAYMDDGEASFCGDKYCRSIDYMRESVESIKQAWYDAGVKKLAGAQLKQQAAPDRRDLQAAGTHPAPCARHCEAKAFEIEIRSLKSQLKQQAEPVHGDIRALKYRIHELEGEVIGYKRMLDVAEAASQPQRKPLTGEQDRALCEAYCNDASDEYFKARPTLDFPEMRRIFYAGHRKAWIGYEAAHGIKENT